MLHTTNLHFSYPNSEALQFPDISCGKGEQWLLLGQSGSGKTTLLHLLGGLLSPTKGIVEVGGKDLKKMSITRLDKFRGKNIGIIFQKAHFIRALTVIENLQLAQKLAGVEVNKKRIAELLERLNVGHKLGAKPSQLSQGEQQRVAIARALVNNPIIMLADEPTSALDDFNCEEVIQLLREEATVARTTLLVVTHDNRLKERFDKQITLSSKSIAN